MLKSIANLGTILNKNEQKSVNGGFGSGAILACNGEATEGFVCYDTPTGNPGTCYLGVCEDC